MHTHTIQSTRGTTETDHTHNFPLWLRSGRWWLLPGVTGCFAVFPTPTVGRGIPCWLRENSPLCCIPDIVRLRQLVTLSSVSFGFDFFFNRPFVCVHTPVPPFGKIWPKTAGNTIDLILIQHSVVCCFAFGSAFQLFFGAVFPPLPFGELGEKNRAPSPDSSRILPLIRSS